MTYNFKDIKPGSPNKLRDIEITIEKFSGIPTSEIALKYGIHRQRVLQICRGVMGRLSVTLDNVPHMVALYHKEWYRRKDGLEIALAYKEFLIKRIIKC